MPKTIINKIIKRSIIATLIFNQGLALAAVNGPRIPSSARPETASRALSATPQAMPETTTQAATSPTSAPANSPLGSEAHKIKFKLTKIILLDNHVYSSTELSGLYADKINQKISVAQLQGIVQSITNYYRNHGYVLTRAILPPQKVTKAGVVKIKVIEGYVDHVAVVGKPLKAKYLLQHYGDHVIASKPLQINDLERYMLLANEIPGVQSKAVLEPSKNTSGAASLDFVTETKPLSGYVSYDNYGTLYIGPREMAAGFEADSILRSGDSTQLNIATTTKPDELKFVQLLHNTPLGTQGLRLIVSGNDAKTQPGLTLQPLKIKGTANTYFGMLQYPLLRTRSKSLTLDASLNWIDSTVLFTSAQATLYADHLRTLRAGANFTNVDGWSGANSLSAHIETGIPSMGGTSVGQGNNRNVQTSRAGASNHFVRIEGDISRQQQFGLWPISIYGIIKGQYAFEPLLSSMQFGFGGVQSGLGRGYDSAEIIGDKGVAGSLEIRSSYFIDKWLPGSSIYAFYDAGIIWNDQAALGQSSSENAMSVGVGARFTFTKHLMGNFLLAKPLTKLVSAYQAAGRNAKAPRVFFGVTATV